MKLQISNLLNQEGQIAQGCTIGVPPWREPLTPAIDSPLQLQEALESIDDELDDGSISQESGSFGGYDGFDDRGMEKSDFPIDCLPGIAGEMAREIARVSTCRCESLAATAVLGIISASTGASLAINSGPDRRTRANLFFLVVADSGTGKTETFQHAAEPLTIIEAEAMKLWEKNEEPVIRSSFAISEARAKRLTNLAANAKDPDKRRELAEELHEVEKEKKELLRRLSSRPCFRVSDVTKEKLVVLMQSQPGEAVTSISSEARGIMSIVSGRYSTSGDDIDFYCAGYSGDAINVDRVKHADRISLRNPCLSTLWMLQPDIARKCFSTEVMCESGLLPRCITFDSQAEPQERTYDQDPISSSTKKGWHSLIEELCATRSAAEPAIVPVSQAATKLFREYENENIRRRQFSGDLANIASYVARWSENAMRIGLVLHAATHGKESGNKELSPDTAESAIRLMRWYSSAQLDFMQIANRKRSRSRMEQLQEILRKDGSGRATLRVLRKNHGFSENEVRNLDRSFQNELSIITEHGSIGGRPSIIVSLTPSRQNPQYPQYSQDL